MIHCMRGLSTGNGVTDMCVTHYMVMCVTHYMVTCALHGDVCHSLQYMKTCHSLHYDICHYMVNMGHSLLRGQVGHGLLLVNALCDHDWYHWNEVALCDALAGDEGQERGGEEQLNCEGSPAAHHLHVHCILIGGVLQELGSEGVRVRGEGDGDIGVWGGGWRSDGTWKVTVLSSLIATLMSSIIPHSSPRALRKLWKCAR